jgi:hypothetical protein
MEVLGGEGSYGSYSFLTSALEWGDGSALFLSHALPLREVPAVHILQEAGLAQETVWMQTLEEKSSASVGN